MQRGEAIQVLRGIIKVCADNSMVISYISLIPPLNDSGVMGFQLKIGTKLDYACRTALMPLLKKNGLGMQENANHILISKRQ